LFIPPEKGFEALPGVLSLFAENGLIAATSEEKLGDVVVSNIFVLAGDDSAGLPKGLDLEELELKPEGAPNTLDCCVPFVICELPKRLVCGALTDDALLNGFHPVPFVEAPKGEAPAVLEAGAKGLNCAREVVTTALDALGFGLVNCEGVPFVTVDVEKSAVLESLGGCIGGDANRTLLF
jgi:hypothetical protein